MIKGHISVGDILYEPRDGRIVEVAGFGNDKFGQKAVFYWISPRKQHMTTARFVFDGFTRLGKV